MKFHQVACWDKCCKESEGNEVCKVKGGGETRPYAYVFCVVIPPAHGPQIYPQTSSLTSTFITFKLFYLPAKRLKFITNKHKDLTTLKLCIKISKIFQVKNINNAFTYD